MVAKHQVRAVAQRTHLAQHGQRLRTAVDRVPDKDQASIGSARKNFVYQFNGAGMAALDVADGVSSH